MTPEEFVKNFYLERKSLVEMYLRKDNKTHVSKLIEGLKLDSEQTDKLRQLLNGILIDAYYTILLGLDGEAQIGESQETYRIEDENGNELTGGEIESYAWEYFHNNKYEFDNSKADFIATLTFLTTEQGGRKTPAFSGYRPQVKFDFSEMQTSGVQTFIDREVVYPGDSVDAEINLISIEHLVGKLQEKMSFEFLEGSRVIGTGQIKRIMNTTLRKDSP